MGTVIAIVIIAFVGLLIVSAMLNSLSKSAQKLQGRNRCSACRSRLKAVNGRYATTCSKCGTRQTPSTKVFDNAVKRSKIVLSAEERASYTAGVKIGDSTGVLVLTNQRLHYSPGRGTQRAQDWALEDIKTVLSLSDAHGFGVRTTAGTKSIFRTPRKTELYDRVLAAANKPNIKALRHTTIAPPKPQTVVQEGGIRTCPWCAETIKSAAILCRFCGRKVDPQSPQTHSIGEGQGGTGTAPPRGQHQ